MKKKCITRRRFTRLTTILTTLGLTGCVDDLRQFDPRGIPGDGVRGPRGSPEGPGNSDRNGATSGDDEMSEQNETTDEIGQDALLRVVHASADAPNVDVSVDGTVTIEDVPFRTVSEYSILSERPHDIRITATDSPETVLFEDELAFNSGTATTLIAIGELGTDSLEVRPYVEDLEPVSDGETRVRVLHASSDAPDLDAVVSESDELLFMDLLFGDVSESTTVPAGAYTLDIRPAGERDTLASFDVEFEPETSYTIVAMGYLRPEHAVVDEPFDLTVAIDAAPK